MPHDHRSLMRLSWGWSQPRAEYPFHLAFASKPRCSQRLYRALRAVYPLRDAQSIRQALSMVLSGLMSGRIPTAQAGKMLFALQTASSDLRKPLKNQEFSGNPF